MDTLHKGDNNDENSNNIFVYFCIGAGFVIRLALLSLGLLDL